MSSKKHRIGLVGCGKITKLKYVPALKALSDRCEIVAFCDIIRERAEHAAEVYGNPNAAIYEDYREMLKDESIEMVYVITPNDSHCSITVDSFAAGKHVMCEKPMAASLADAEKMMEAWKKSGKQFSITYQNRCRPAMLALHEACRSGELGEIYFAKTHAIRRRDVPTWGEFLNKKIQGGGPLIDIGTHALDIVLWLMDNYEPVSVVGSVSNKLKNVDVLMKANSWGRWNPEEFETEDGAFAFLRMANGAVIFLETAWILNMVEPKESATTLCGTLGGAEIDWSVGFHERELTINRPFHGILVEGTNSDFSIPFAHMLARTEMHELGVTESNFWFDAVETGGKPLVEPEQAFWVTKIIDAIYRSAEEGREIVF